jgi:hypothetical protein
MNEIFFLVSTRQMCFKSSIGQGMTYQYILRPVVLGECEQGEDVVVVVDNDNNVTVV